MRFRVWSSAHITLCLEYVALLEGRIVEFGSVDWRVVVDEIATLLLHTAKPITVLSRCMDNKNNKINKNTTF